MYFSDDMTKHKTQENPYLLHTGNREKSLSKQLSNFKCDEPNCDYAAAQNIG